jgi:hypothetical protein
MLELTLILVAWLQIRLSKHKTDVVSSLLFIKKCPDLCIFWGFVQMRSGRHAVNIDFRPLGLISDLKEGGGGFWGLKI